MACHGMGDSFFARFTAADVVPPIFSRERYLIPCDACIDYGFELLLLVVPRHVPRDLLCRSASIIPNRHSMKHNLTDLVAACGRSPLNALGESIEDSSGMPQV